LNNFPFNEFVDKFYWCSLRAKQVFDMHPMGTNYGTRAIFFVMSTKTIAQKLAWVQNNGLYACF